MDILIKGMEMPKSCAKCLEIGWHYVFECVLDDVEHGERKTDCPLIPVPQHGRLGDLDALAQQIEHERFHHTHTDGLAARHHVAEYGHFLKAISDAPTIIQAEEGE